MATGERIDPYQNFRFRLEIDGLQTAGFSQVSLADSSTGEIEYREGTDTTTPRKLSGLTKYGNITLKKGVTDSLDLYEWRKSIEDMGAGPNRKNFSIILIDEEGNDKARWDITNGWPTKISNSDLKATGEEVLIETMEIVHEGVTRVS